MAYKYQGNFKNAVSNFRTASEQNPDHYDAWLQLGDLHALAKNELAVAYFNNAIRVDSSRYEGHYNKGYFLQENGEYQEALQVYSDLIRHNNSFYNAYFNRGYIYLEYLNEPDSAIHEFSKTIGFNPLNYKAFYNRGLAYEQAGNSSEALINFSKALELKPDYDLAAQAKSRVLEK
jgi:tetratricopeptide (TPR) repeat protein